MNAPGRPVAFVFDSSPLTAYAAQTDLMIPSLVATSLSRDRVIAVSAVSLAEAYRLLAGTQVDLLGMLTGGELAAAFLVAGLDMPTARGLGRLAGTSPSASRHRRAPLDRLHTAALATRHTAGIVTADPEPYQELLGDDWPILVV